MRFLRTWDEGFARIDERAKTGLPNRAIRRNALSLAVDRRPFSFSLL
jgi:hypothetical protein